MKTNPLGDSQRGAALVSMLLCTGFLAMLSVSLVAVGLALSNEERAVGEKIHAQYVAEAGLSRAMADLRRGGTGQVGSAGNSITYGESTFWVDATQPGADLWTLTATGVDDRSGARVELTLRQSIESLWRWAAFGDTDLNADSNAQVDSYDSTAGTYASQAVNGSGADQHALSNGDLGSNGNVIAESNVKVWGNANSGPNSTTTVTGNAQISGSTTPMAEPIALPPIVVPSIPWTSPLTVPGIMNLAAGDHGYSNLTIDGTLNLTGPARIVVGTFRIRSNAELIVDATNGPVEIWVIHDFLINSNSMIRSTTYSPADIAVNLLSDNIINPEIEVDVDEDAVDFDSNAKMYGTIYAPNAHLEVDSNFELFGSMVASSIDLDSNCKIHFDESLAAARDDETFTWQRVACRALPYHK